MTVEPTPADVEVLAREFYEVVMNATADHWVTWEHADQQARAGYYEHAFDVADRVRESFTCRHNVPEFACATCPAIAAASRIGVPACSSHREVQHRDGQPPWCEACGWSHGVTVPARKIR